MVRWQPLLAPGSLIEAEFPYGPLGVVQDMLRSDREEVLTRLSGAPSAQVLRPPVRLEVLNNLISKLERARGDVAEYVNKFIAHSAPPDDRQATNADAIKITYDHLLAAHKQLCEVAGFVSIYLLGDACPGFLPTPQFDQFEDLDEPIIDSADLSTLESVWREMDAACDRSSQWSIEDYELEFGPITGSSVPSEPASRSSPHQLS